MDLRIPPHNIEAEQALLAAMIINPGIIGQVMEMIKPEGFYRESHIAICQAIFELKQDADLVTVKSQLEKNNTLEKAGGQDYLMSLADSHSTSAGWEYYCGIIKDLSVRRELINRVNAALEQLWNQGKAVQDTIASLKSGLIDSAHDIIDYADNRRLYVERYEDIISDDGKEPGLFAEIPGIENKFFFEAGYIHCIAARSNSGKTAIAVQIADSIQSKYGPVVFYSLESMRSKLANRIIARRSNIALSRLHYRNLTATQEYNLKNILHDLTTSRLYLIDSTEYRFIERLTIHAENYIQKHGIKCIFVDFLQLMYSSAKTFRGSRHLEISYVVGEIKSLAKNLNIPIIFLSQLKRKDGNPRPGLEDLKESGDIENNTDNVLFLHAIREQDEVEYPVEFFMGKGKDQERFSVWLHFNGHFQEFKEGYEPEIKSKRKNWKEEA